MEAQEEDWYRINWGFNRDLRGQMNTAITALRAVLEAEPTDEIERLRNGLENCRLYAARTRGYEWAKTILRFCDESGVSGSITRAALEAESKEPVAWKDVVGYEGMYSVSSDGRVKNLKTGNELSTNSRMGAGYVKVELWSGNKRKQTTMHRVVAEAFLPTDGKKEVNHKNGIKTDNRVENLEWVTRAENQNHSFYELGHIVRPVCSIDKASGEVTHYPSVCAAVRDGFHSAHVHDCLAGRREAHKGKRWEYTSPPTSKDAGRWIDPNDKTQKKFLPHIGEKCLFCYEGKTYYGRHTGGSFQSFAPPERFDTWRCLWMPLPAAMAKGEAA